MSRAFGRHVIGRSGHGAIVNISSITGLQGYPASNAYGVSKAAIAHMTKNMASEWARRGIRVNCVAPGYIDAPMAHALFDEGISRERLEKRIPMRRLGNAGVTSRIVIPTTLSENIPETRSGDPKPRGRIVERPEPVDWRGYMIPEVVACKADMRPAKRRAVAQQVVGDIPAVGSQTIRRPLHI